MSNYEDSLMGSLGFETGVPQFVSYETSASQVPPVRVHVEPSHYVTDASGRIYAAIPKVGPYEQPGYLTDYQPPVQSAGAELDQHRPSRTGKIIRFGAALALSGMTTVMVGGTIFSGDASKDLKKDLRIAKTMPSFVYDQYHWLFKERK